MNKEWDVKMVSVGKCIIDAFESCHAVAEVWLLLSFLLRWSRKGDIVSHS
jgi:hypothetical protein